MIRRAERRAGFLSHESRRRFRRSSTATANACIDDHRRKRRLELASGVDGAECQSAAQKKQGATGITTVAPYVAGQWGRGNNRLPG